MSTEPANREAAETASADSIADSPKRFFNRELSWLGFNWRVLEESENTRHPLLERLRFLSISANNLDEFFMVRAAGLRQQVKAGVDTMSADGLTPAEQLRAVRLDATRLMAKQQERWRALKRDMKEAGVVVVAPNELNAADRSWLEKEFLEEIFPLLTPLAVDPAHPFPFIPNQGFALALSLRRRADDERTISLLPIPQQTRRFFQLPTTGNWTERDAVRRFISLENMISTQIHHLLPGHDVLAQGCFRIIRDSDIELEEEAEDLVRYFESQLKKRRRGDIVLLKIEAGMPEDLQSEIIKRLGAEPEEVVRSDGILGLSATSELVLDDRPDLKFTPYEPRFPERIREHGGDCFAAIRAKDIVVHHPYESFDVVVQFLRQAAADHNVVSIKQTLYRTSKYAPIVASLIESSEAGKIVTAVCEL